MPHFDHCHERPVRPRAEAPRRRAAHTVHLGLAGLGCPSCANRVRNALLGVPGVIDAEIDLPAALATVWHLTDLCSTGDLVEAVREASGTSHHRYLAVPLRSRFSGKGSP